MALFKKQESLDDIVSVFTQTIDKLNDLQDRHEIKVKELQDDADQILNEIHKRKSETARAVAIRDNIRKLVTEV